MDNKKAQAMYILFVIVLIVILIGSVVTIYKLFDIHAAIIRTEDRTYLMVWSDHPVERPHDKIQKDHNWVPVQNLFEDFERS